MLLLACYNADLSTSSPAPVSARSGNRMTTLDNASSRSNAGRVGIICDYCDKRFAKREHLKRHLGSHRNERPYTCKLCHKSYGRSDVLRRHERSHTGSNEPRTLTAESTDMDTTEDLCVLGEASPFELSVASTGAQEQSLLERDWNRDVDQFLLPADFDFDSFESLLYDPTIALSQVTPPLSSHSERTDFASVPSRQISGLANLPPPSEAADRDEQYRVEESNRDDITVQLTPAVQPFETLLSTEYLNLCLQLYFKQFHPIFPVIHTATFRPQKHNTLLLISICSIGSLFIGSIEAKSQGYMLYKRLNKAILASWEGHLFKSKRSGLLMTQAALLGQTFGLMSDNAEDRFMSEAFHGTILSLARRAGSFDTLEPITLKITLSGKALHDTWLEWIRAEEIRRLGLALYIHDVELAYTFRREPYLRHHAVRYCTASSDNMFSARSAEEWQSLYSQQQSNDASVTRDIQVNDWASINVASQPSNPITQSIEKSAFSAYARLANIGALLLEHRTSPSQATEHEDCGQSAMSHWHSAFSHRCQTEPGDHLCLKVLWHYYAMLSYANFARLRNAIDARCESPEVASARAWAVSSGAPHALLHVYLLHKTALALPLGLSPPIHLPRAIYSAAIVFIAYWRFSQSTNRSIGEEYGHQQLVQEMASLMLNMPDIAVLAEAQEQTTEHLVSLASDSIIRGRSTFPFSCVDLLRKLLWGVSSVHADKLQTLARSGLEPL